ncbi:hypothetical protein GCM10027289_21120 [Tsukamurella serpentis]
MRDLARLDPVDAVRGWLTAPHRERGIHLARDGAGEDLQDYGALADRSLAIADRLRRCGLRSGDVACVIMPTDFECAATIYAVWAAGGAVTPITPPSFTDLDRYGEHVAAIVDQASPRLVVTCSALAQVVDDALARSRSGARRITLDDPASDPQDVAVPAGRTAGGLSTPGRYALLQFTSGSSGTPRGVLITWSALAANIDLIAQTLHWRDGEAMASWLPLYHDMGLIGGFLTPVTLQEDLHLLRPDQFIRDPARWLRAMTVAVHSPSPSFALGYTAARLRAEHIEELDLSGWKTLAVGAEPVQTADLRSFCRLTEDRGFDPRAIIPAYGLAESTLLVSGAGPDTPAGAVRPRSSSLRFGEPVLIDRRGPAVSADTGDGRWIVGLGRPRPQSPVRIVDADGGPLPDGTLGEVVVAGTSVAAGYVDDAQVEGGTRITGGEVHTGDAGFLLDGELFVLGRMATSIKVRGRSVFMEDIESAVSAECGMHKGRLAAVALTDAGSQGVALFAEEAPGEWIARARTLIRGELGPAQTVTVVTGPRGLIHRTSSGKPRRRHMWRLYCDGAMPGAVTHHADGTAGADAVATAAGDRDVRRPSLDPHRVAELLDRALESVVVPADCAVLFEGSLAEGFGNEGSDVDFLVVASGAEEMPTLPSVLFGDGRRLEIRTRSVAQVRAQLDTVARAAAQDRIADLTEDVLNRCQRFLRSTTVRGSENVDPAALRAIVPHREFAGIVAQWWTLRTIAVTRQIVALRLLGEPEEARGWAGDALVQAAKVWCARHGETYLETKWLPRQLDRAGAESITAGTQSDVPVAARLRGAEAELAGADEDWWDGVQHLLADLLGDAADGAWQDCASVRLARVPGVTTWEVGGRVHVIRGGEDVFALSEDAARSWRTVVFRRPLAQIAGAAPSGVQEGAHRAALAEFVRLGLIGLEWGSDGPIRPALAMCEAQKPYTPPPFTGDPVLCLVGAVTTGTGAPVVLAPLPAPRFASAALDLTWANIVAENAREDLVGAVKSAQPQVAAVAAHRLIAMCVRMVAASHGVHPLPADIAPVRTVARLVPPNAAQRDRLLADLDAAIGVDFPALFDTGTDPLDGLRAVDALLTTVREITGGIEFPPSFDSREQWRRTLEISYDWVRMGTHLGVELPLAEAGDLMDTGGGQPHAAGES